MCSLHACLFLYFVMCWSLIYTVLSRLLCPFCYAGTAWRYTWNGTHGLLRVPCLPDSTLSLQEPAPLYKCKFSLFCFLERLLELILFLILTRTPGVLSLDSCHLHIPVNLPRHSSSNVVGEFITRRKPIHFSYINCGFWNVNGWSSDTNSEVSVTLNNLKY